MIRRDRGSRPLGQRRQLEIGDELIENGLDAHEAARGDEVGLSNNSKHISKSAGQSGPLSGKGNLSPVPHLPNYNDPDYLLDLNKFDLDEFSKLATITNLKGAALRRAWVQRKRESK